MKFTSAIRIDTDYIEDEDDLHIALDFCFDDVREEMVKLYASHRTGKEEAA